MEVLGDNQPIRTDHLERLERLLAAERTLMGLEFTYTPGNQAWTPPRAGLPPHLKEVSLEEQFRRVMVALGYPSAANLTAGEVGAAAIAAMRPFMKEVEGEAAKAVGITDLGRDLWRRSLKARGFDDEWTDQEIDDAAHRAGVEHRHARRAAQGWGSKVQEQDRFPMTLPAAEKEARKHDGSKGWPEWSQPAIDEAARTHTLQGVEREKELIRQVLREELKIGLNWDKMHECPATLTVSLMLTGEQPFDEDETEI